VVDFEKLDYLQELDGDRIPNKSYLPDYLVPPGNVIGSWISQEGICYNKDAFRKLGISEPGTYADLIHTSLEGRVSFPDINSGGGLANLGGIVYAAGGDETNIEPGLKMIEDIKVLKF